MPKKAKIKVTYAPGTIVKFLGYSGETPDVSLLKKNAEYEIHAANNADSSEFELSYYVRIPNANFDPDEPPSDENSPFFLADVFPDEVEFVAAPEETSKEAEAVKEAEETAPYQVDLVAEIFTKLQKGDVVELVDVASDTYVGVVCKKTKTLLGVEVGPGEVISFRLKDITSLSPQEMAPEKPVLTEKKKRGKKATDAVTGETTVEVEKEVSSERRGRGRPKGSKNKKTVEREEKYAARKAKQAEKGELPVDVEDEMRGFLILDESEEDQEILQIIDEADDICTLAEELAQEAANVDYRLGGVLYHVKLSQAYKKLNPDFAGPSGFPAYTEQVLGMHYRKAMYLINIYTKWNKYGLDANKVADIGWSKAQIISSHMTEDNAETLLELAENSSVTDLRDAIRESTSRKGKDTREIVKKVTIKLRFMEEQAMIIQDYLEMAMKELDRPKLEDVVEYIITEWAQEHLDVSKLRKAKRAVAARLKEAHQDAVVEPATVEAKKEAKPVVQRRKATRQQEAAA